MNCCEQTGTGAGCNQGRNCPVRSAAKAPRTRTCDELGVCQRIDCTNCEQPMVNTAGEAYPPPIVNIDQDLNVPRSRAENGRIALVIIGSCLLLAYAIKRAAMYAWATWVA